MADAWPWKMFHGHIAATRKQPGLPEKTHCWMQIWLWLVKFWQTQNKSKQTKINDILNIFFIFGQKRRKQNTNWENRFIFQHDMTISIFSDWPKSILFISWWKMDQFSQFLFCLLRFCPNVKNNSKRHWFLFVLIGFELSEILLTSHILKLWTQVTADGDFFWPKS